MAQAYFLIPGLIPGPKAKDKISRNVLDRLAKTLGRLSEDPVMQPLGQPVFSKSVHLSWLWSVLTRRALPFSSAAYAWAVQNGPMLSGDIWSLRLCVKTAEGALEDAALTFEQNEAACAAISPVLQQTGFVLQRWDPHLYLTRKKPLSATAAPFAVVSTQPGGVDHWTQGPEKNVLTELIGACEKTLQALESPAQTIWLSGGGGDFEYVYPPTKIRSVLTDNDTVKGWALAAGILLQRIGRMSGAAVWPEDAPQGECIALLENLYRPWLLGDWQTWQEQIEPTCDQIDALAEAARSKGCQNAVIVGTGEGFSVTCRRRLSGMRNFLARLTASQVDPSSLLFLENAQ